MGSALFNEQNSTRMLSSYEIDNLKGLFIGRIFLLLVKQYMDYLVPGNIYWAGRHGITSSDLKEDTFTKQRSELFPFGPLAVERWSNDFLEIRNSFEFLYLCKDRFLKDVHQFINQLDDGNKKLYIQFDYGAWLDEIDKTLSTIEAHNYHIQSLLRLKNSYSREVRLPNLFWMSCLGILCFILGIILPLLLNGLEKESLVPPAFNISLLAATFALMIGGIFLLGKDVLSTYKNEEIYKYFLPLREQVVNYEKDAPRFINYGYDVVNEILNDKKITKPFPDLIKTLGLYRDAIVSSNFCSEQIVNGLSESIQQSAVLQRNKAQFLSGGQSIGILSLFSPDSRQALSKKIRSSSDNFIFQANYEGMTRDIFKLKPPRDRKELDEVLSEIDRIYKEHFSNPEVQACLSRREMLANLRKKLLRKLEEVSSKK
jgi:hypothetical protein